MVTDKNVLRESILRGNFLHRKVDHVESVESASGKIENKSPSFLLILRKERKRQKVQGNRVLL